MCELAGLMMFGDGLAMLRKSDMFWDIARLINDKVISIGDLEKFSYLFRFRDVTLYI